MVVLAELMKQLFMQMQERMLWVNQQVTLCVSEAQNEAEKEQMVQVLKQSGVRESEDDHQVIGHCSSIGAAH